LAAAVREGEAEADPEGALDTEGPEAPGAVPEAWTARTEIAARAAAVRPATMIPEPILATVCAPRQSR
jgi:hypothetical protein